MSRRDVLRSMGVGMVSFPLVAVVLGPWTGQAVQAQEKVSKESVQYQNSPKDGQQCAKCNFFVPPNACQRVEGEINPQGWCTLYTPKQG